MRVVLGGDSAAAQADQDYNFAMQQVGQVSWPPSGLAEFGIPSESSGAFAV